MVVASIVVRESLSVIAELIFFKLRPFFQEELDKTDFPSPRRLQM